MSKEKWIEKYIIGLYGSRCNEYCLMNHVRFYADNDRWNYQYRVRRFHFLYC